MFTDNGQEGFRNKTKETHYLPDMCYLTKPFVMFGNVCSLKKKYQIWNTVQLQYCDSIVWCWYICGCLSIYAIICHSCTVCIKISILWDYFHYSQLLVVLNSFFRVNIFHTNEFPLRCWGKQRLTEWFALTCIFYRNLSLNIATKAISYIEVIWQLVRLK